MVRNSWRTLVFLSLLMPALSKLSAVPGPKLVEEFTKVPGKIKFDSRNFSFGEVKRGQVLVHDFAFENIGKGDLIIQGVHASCGCTAAELNSTKIYHPGEKGTLRISFDTKDFTGSVSKSLTVLTNEKRRNVKILTVKAKVQNPIDVKPPLLDLDTISSDQEVKRTIDIAAVGGESFSIDSISAPDGMDTKLAELGTGKWELAIELKPQEPGDLKEVVYLNTSLPHLKKVAIPIVGKVEGKISHSPQYIEFGAVAENRHKLREVILEGEGEFKVLEALVNMEVNGEEVDGVDLIKVDFDNTAKGKHKMAIKIQNKNKLSGSVYGDIELLTDHPNHRTIKMDFFAFFQE